LNTLLLPEVAEVAEVLVAAVELVDTVQVQD
jgi:hypothetical protein